MTANQYEELCRRFLAEQLGVLIMREVMNTEVASLTRPRGQHQADREVCPWKSRQGYEVLVQ